MGKELKLAFDSQIWSSWHEPKQRKRFYLGLSSQIFVVLFFLVYLCSKHKMKHIFMTSEVTKKKQDHVLKSI